MPQDAHFRGVGRNVLAVIHLTQCQCLRYRHIPSPPYLVTTLPSGSTVSTSFPMVNEPVISACGMNSFLSLT